MKAQWENLSDGTVSHEDLVRRLRVPGGWLYQVGYSLFTEPLTVEQPNSISNGWHAPVFVPDREAVP